MNHDYTADGGSVHDNSKLGPTVVHSDLPSGPLFGGGGHMQMQAPISVPDPRLHPGIPVGGLAQGMRFPQGMAPPGPPWYGPQVPQYGQHPGAVAAANGRPEGVKAEAAGGWIWSYAAPPQQWVQQAPPQQWQQPMQQQPQRAPESGFGSGPGSGPVKREAGGSYNSGAVSGALPVPNAAAPAEPTGGGLPGNDSAGSGGSVGIPQGPTHAAGDAEAAAAPRFCFQCGKALKRAGAPFCSICGSAQI